MSEDELDYGTLLEPGCDRQELRYAVRKQRDLLAAERERAEAAEARLAAVTEALGKLAIAYGQYCRAWAYDQSLVDSARAALAAAAGEGKEAAKK